MSNFKLFMIALILLTASCFPMKDNPAQDLPELQTIVYDGCEYLAYKSFSGATELTHKGNCRFCTKLAPKYYVREENDTTWLKWSPSKLKDHEN